jgi:hypothetical protein
MKHYFLSRHLNESNLTYTGHMFRALRFSMMILGTLILSMIHAFIPFLFEKCVTNLMNNLLKEDLDQSS